MRYAVIRNSILEDDQRYMIWKVEEENQVKKIPDIPNGWKDTKKRGELRDLHDWIEEKMAEEAKAASKQQKSQKSTGEDAESS